MNHLYIDICIHRNAPNDEDVRAMCCIVRASGNFDKVDWFRAFDTEKRKAGTKALDVMNIYTSVVVVAWVKYCIFNR